MQRDISLSLSLFFYFVRSLLFRTFAEPYSAVVRLRFHSISRRLRDLLRLSMIKDTFVSPFYAITALRANDREKKIPWGFFKNSARVSLAVFLLN